MVFSTRMVTSLPYTYRFTVDKLRGALQLTDCLNAQFVQLCTVCRYFCSIALCFELLSKSDLFFILGVYDKLYDISCCSLTCSERLQLSGFCKLFLVSWVSYGFDNKIKRSPSVLPEYRCYISIAHIGLRSSTWRACALLMRSFDETWQRATGR